MTYALKAMRDKNVARAVMARWKKRKEGQRLLSFEREIHILY